MKKIMIAALFAVTVMLTQSTIQAQPYYYDWVNSGTGDWSEAANWNNGVPALVPGNDIYIGTGGRAEITWDTYENLGNNDPVADSVMVANGSTLYLDSYLNGVKNVTLTGGSQLIQTWAGEININGGKGNEFKLLENSTMTVNAQAWNYYYFQRLTGDGTGTILINENAFQYYSNEMEVSDVNIKANVSGTAVISALSGNGEVTVISGNLIIEEDNRTGGNTYVDSGGLYGNITVNNGNWLHGGSGRVGTVWLKSGGLISSWLVMTDSLMLEDGAIIQFEGGNALTFTGGTGGIYLDGSTGVIIDFRYWALYSGEDTIVMDWTGTGGYFQMMMDASQFTAGGLAGGMGGTFSVEDSQLVFHASAIPEPSTYFLLGTGLGLLLLTARCRRQAGTDA